MYLTLVITLKLFEAHIALQRCINLYYWIIFFIKVYNEYIFYYITSFVSCNN